MPRLPWQDDPIDPAEAAVCLERVGERSDEPGLVGGVESFLPPQPEDPQNAAATVDPRLDPPDEAVAEEDGQDVITPSPLRRRHVDLPDVVEAVQLA